MKFQVVLSIKSLGRSTRNSLDKGFGDTDVGYLALALIFVDEGCVTGFHLSRAGSAGDMDPPRIALLGTATTNQSAGFLNRPIACVLGSLGFRALPFS